MAIMSESESYSPPSPAAAASGGDPSELRLMISARAHRAALASSEVRTLVICASSSTSRFTDWGEGP